MLTAQAQKNLDSGATDGAGTDVCRCCQQTKEPTRINSSRCRLCGKGCTIHQKIDLSPARPVESETEMSDRMIRVRVASATYDRLVAEAMSLRVPLAAHVRGLLTASESAEKEKSDG